MHHSASMSWLALEPNQCRNSNPEEDGEIHDTNTSRTDYINITKQRTLTLCISYGAAKLINFCLVYIRTFMRLSGWVIRQGGGQVSVCPSSELITTPGSAVKSVFTAELEAYKDSAGLILGWHPDNERRYYFVTTSLIGQAQAYNQLCSGCILPYRRGCGFMSIMVIDCVRCLMFDEWWDNKDVQRCNHDDVIK